MRWRLAAIALALAATMLLTTAAASAHRMGYDRAKKITMRYAADTAEIWDGSKRRFQGCDRKSDHRMVCAYTFQYQEEELVCGEFTGACWTEYEKKECWGEVAIQLSKRSSYYSTRGSGPDCY
jgi:hypothetical protein